MSALDVPPSAATVPAQPRRLSPWWEGLGLLLAPGVAALLLGRVPEAATATAVGTAYGLALAGTVPAYLWLRGRSVAVGALVVVLVLSSPGLLTTGAAAGPDAVALVCLFAAFPLLAVWRTGRRRLLARAAGGVFLGVVLSVHPQAGPVVAAALVALAASAFSRHTGVRRARTRRVSRELAAVLGAGLVTVLVGRTLVGHEFVARTGPDDAVVGGPPTPLGLVVPAVVLTGWTILVARRRRLRGSGRRAVTPSSCSGPH